MFYSHEILTQRKYGVATIWLVATLGLSKSVVRKVGRKEILGVNLPKACTTVINPDVPLALRLQSGLLIGISRVYYQQTEYLFHDVSHAHQNVIQFQMQKTANVDLSRGVKARDAERLILANDPTLLPEMLDLDLGELEFDLEKLAREGPDVDFGTSQLTGSMRSEVSSIGEEVGLLPLSIPSSPPHEEMEEHPPFEFTADGFLKETMLEYELPAPAPPGIEARRPPAGFEPTIEDIEARVRAQHEEFIVSPEIEMEEAAPAPLEEEAPVARPFEVPEAELEVEERPVARVGRPRRAGPIQDVTTKLAGPLMKASQINYLRNMEIARKDKESRQAKRAARENAQFWVLEHGFTGPLLNPALKELFSGQAFYDRFAPILPPGVGVGAAREALEEERMVSPMPAGEVPEEEIGRAMEAPAPLPEHPPTEEMEIGREAPPPEAEVEESFFRERFSPAEGPGPSSSAAPGSIPGSPDHFRPARGVSRISVAESNLAVLPEAEREYESPAREFEFFPPEAGMEAEMEKESRVFYELVKKKISEERARREEEMEEEEAVPFVVFQDIVKPGIDGRQAAAQNFYYLLVLATKDMLAVSQAQHYGPIQISVL